jgi:(1->4)-alpha-D-glucan 1-alpha-D-glucosylmutase
MSEARNHRADVTGRGRPEATYRLQFHKGFTFRQAEALTGYFRALGITHVYASPYFEAVPGSTHGYDVINHNRLNPELGTREDYDAWTTALARAGLSHILDVVPNHVGVATNHNAWWNDVLRYGPASPFARYFDITWEGSPRPELHNKLLLPVLGVPYGKALDDGQLMLAWEDGEIVARYHERFFPMDPGTLGPVLERAAGGLKGELAREVRALVEEMARLPAACTSDEAGCRLRREMGERVRTRVKALHAEDAGFRAGLEGAIASFNERRGGPEDADGLDALLNAQAYRLAYWRVASDEINYRRFFDINDLAALAMERPEVFEMTHRFLFELIRNGTVAGIRIDHPDGLYDPVQYFRRLQEAVPGLYVVIEKILGAEEALSLEWPVDGTSGYDFLVRVNNLFVDPAGEAEMDRVYAEFTGREGGRGEYAQRVYQNKRMILETALASELQMLAHEADRLAQRDRHSRDFTLRTLREALREIIACFPVYRSYVTDAGERGEGGASAGDRRCLDQAIEEATRRNPAMSTAPLAFIRAMVLQEAPKRFSAEVRQRQRRFAGKFQQLTAPATAKGIEDTTFYQYHRLLSLNEVGGEPGLFGSPPETLHAYFAQRQERWPYALSVLSTHDTKRSEDVRARLNVLSELPEEWGRQVTRWFGATAHLWPKDAAELDTNDAYLLFQTVLGAWPLGAQAADETFVKRIQAFMTKAMREAKVHTRWTDPNAAYEGAMGRWIESMLGSAAFLREFVPFARQVSRCGLTNSLAQTVLRLTAPGVPDLYQGTEVWDFSLVDPDNRRPVDYATRGRMLEELAGGADLGELLQHAEDGGVKLWVNRALLALRQEFPGLFTRGEYVPLSPTGDHASRVFAFARRHEGREAVVVVPRLVAKWEGRTAEEVSWPVGELWGDTRVDLPVGGGSGSGGWREALSSREIGSGQVAELFRVAPIAVLIRP